MASIQFDGTELLTSAYMPQFLKHESAPDRQLMSLALARDDGEVLIAERYGRKTITLKGTLKASTQADLDTAIDAFKELLSRPEKNLDISWEAGTRRYVATCSRHEFDRDHYHTNAVPWTAEFVVPSGEGSDTSTTLAADAVSVGFTPPTPAATSVSLSGSKGPRPTITLANLDFGTGVRGLEYKNTDTGERLVVTYPGEWGNDRTVTIDCDAKTVTGDAVNGATKSLNFFGVFPKWRVGTNNISITCGGIVNQKSADTSLSELNANLQLLSATTRHYAQSFVVPYTDETFQGIQLAIKKTGTPGNITWRIETDGSGAPSGTLVHANATGTIAAGDTSTSLAYVVDYATSPFTLNANTTYWLVVSAAATLDVSNRYEFATAAQPTYGRGYAKLSDDSGSTWANFANKTDFSFRILCGGSQATINILHTFSYLKTFL
jgi:hypothetical protein